MILATIDPETDDEVCTCFGVSEKVLDALIWGLLPLTQIDALEAKLINSYHCNISIYSGVWTLTEL